MSSIYSLFIQMINRWDVILLGLLFLLFVSLGSYGLGMNIRDKRKKILEKLVRKRTRELEKANEELKLRNSELDRFVYSASHDLSSPLKSILGLINVAKLENPGADQLKYLNMMQTSVNKLESFIEEVIQYSRNARLSIRYESYQFKNFAADILQSYQYVINYDKISFEVEDNTGKPIITDGMRLKIILNNLISNAIKFHRIDTNPKPIIKIKREANLKNDVISVEDNGRGIESEYTEKVFEMFFRGTEEVPGSGLGLYILKEIVNRLNGEVNLKSEVGKGTTFTITLPRAE
ncbi:MAG TPA: HAMP domain-containing sensor histidine kinase [Cyclobacteriaceae bacterium]|nr:HAMP domain-containing sensor histidine kinase [Cyclobacteriaceae bacterium]